MVFYTEISQFAHKICKKCHLDLRCEFGLLEKNINKIEYLFGIIKFCQFGFGHLLHDFFLSFFRCLKEIDKYFNTNSHISIKLPLPFHVPFFAIFNFLSLTEHDINIVSYRRYIKTFSTLPHCIYFNASCSFAKLDTLKDRRKKLFSNNTEETKENR